MILKCLRQAIQLKWLEAKRRYFPSIPLLGRVYCRNTLGNDMLNMLLVKSRLQENVMKTLYGNNIEGVVFNSFNGSLVNSLSDVIVSDNLGFNGSYDKDKILYLLSLLKPGSCVYIVGAHIGTLVVPVARFVRKVVTFEANPSTYRLLSWNISLNQLKNVEFYNYAIYNKQTELSFYQNRANTGGSKIKPVSDHFWYNYDNPAEIKVKTRILDEFAALTENDYPDMIIMDIEGAEYAALQGASNCLRHARHLYIEFMPHHLSNVANITLKEFVDSIIAFFPLMSIPDEAVKGGFSIYTGDSIFEKLTEYYNRNMGVDILFLKEK